MSVDGTIQAKLVATSAVSDIVGTRAYLIDAPQTAAAPFLVFYRGGGGPLQTLSGPIATSELKYDVISVAKTIGQARSLAAAIAGALDGWSDKTVSPSIESCGMDSQEDGPLLLQDDSEEGLRTVVQTFTVWTGS